MKNNDITYEYRVFTNRLIDVESMEVGKCTSKVIKELKQKDKVDGRFFHTSDTDEWFFCWNGSLQKLNLKGNEDLNSALDKVEKLISEANSTVESAKETANEAKEAAANAKTAADSANAAVESIENKADKSDVEAVSKIVEDKADKSTVEDLSQDVAEKADKSTVENLSQTVSTKAEQSYVKELSDKIDSIKVDDFATKSDISKKQDEIKDLDTIRSGASAGATALQSIPEEYVTETELEGKGYLTEHQDLSEYALRSELPTVPTNVSSFANDAGYLTKEVADGYYAVIGSTGSGDGVSKDYVDAELAKKQDIINDIEDIRSNAATALQKDALNGYVTEDELNKKGYLTEQALSGKQDVIENLDDIISGASAGATALQPDALNDYVTSENVYTKNEIDGKINAINALIGDATNITNTILA